MELKEFSIRSILVKLWGFKEYMVLRILKYQKGLFVICVQRLLMGFSAGMGVRCLAPRDEGCINTFKIGEYFAVLP